MDFVAQRHASTAAQLDETVQLRTDTAQYATIRSAGNVEYLPFIQSHDCRTFVFENGLIRVNTNKKLGSQTTCLEHGASMAMMGKVEAAIHPDAIVADWDVFLRVDGPLTRSWNALRDGQRL